MDHLQICVEELGYTSIQNVSFISAVFSGLVLTTISFNILVDESTRFWYSFVGIRPGERTWGFKYGYKDEL
jgi:hypothetical protein